MDNGLDIECVDKYIQDCTFDSPQETPKNGVFDQSTNKGSVKGWVLGLNTGQTAR